MYGRNSLEGFNYLNASVSNGGCTPDILYHPGTNATGGKQL